MRRFTSITALSVFALTTLGCSNDPEPTNTGNMDMSVADVNEPDLNSPDSGRVDSGSGPDTGMVNVNPVACDAVLQDCVDPAATCGITFLPDGLTESVCRASLGEVGAGESCTQPNDVPGEDDCAAGYICHGYTSPAGDPPPRICLETCRGNSCGAGRFCIPLNIYATVGMCTDICDPLGNDCVEGTKCSNFYTFAENYWICTKDAGASVGDPCTGSEQCGAGQWCPFDTNGGRTCEEFCKDDLRCDDGGACSPAPILPGYGKCEPVDWSCAGTPWPAATATDSDVTVTVTGSGSGLVGATVKACATGDADCAAPIASGITEAGGDVTLSIPAGDTGFYGYFEVTADGYLPALVFANAPIGTSTATVQVTMATDNTATAPFAWTGGLTLDATRGHITSVIEPCSGGGGAQVALTSSLSDGSTTIGYVSELANGGRFDSALTSTTINGQAGIANHPVGSPLLTYTNSVGAAVATRQVVVRAGALTVVGAVPTP